MYDQELIYIYTKMVYKSTNKNFIFKKEVST